MPQQKLSKSKVEEIPPAAKDVFVWDAALPGFGVRVKPTAVRSYAMIRCALRRLASAPSWLPSAELAFAWG